MPRIEVAGDICLRRPWPVEGCRTYDDDDDDDNDDDDDDDDDDVHLVTTSTTHGNSFPPELTFMTPYFVKET